MIFEPAARVLLPSVDVISYVFDNAYDANRPIYVDVHNPSRSITCAQARKIVRQLIAGLRAWGVKPGDCVAIHAFNDIYYCMLVLAIVGAGGIYTGTNPSYTPMELAHHFQASGTKFVISEPEILAPVLAAVKERDIPEENVLVFDVLGQEVPAGRRSWNDLFHHGEQDWVAFNDLQRAKETTAARLFSSGTTGLPKAVTITHHNLVTQHESVFEVHPRPYQVILVQMQIRRASPVNGIADFPHRRNPHFPRCGRHLDTLRRPQVRSHNLHDAPLRPSDLLGSQRKIPNNRPSDRAAHRDHHPDVPILTDPAVPRLHQDRQLRCRPAQQRSASALPHPPQQRHRHSIYPSLGHDRDMLHRDDVPVPGARRHGVRRPANPEPRSQANRRQRKQHLRVWGPRGTLRARAHRHTGVLPEPLRQRRGLRRRGVVQNGGCGVLRRPHAQVVHCRPEERADQGSWVPGCAAGAGGCAPGSSGNY